MSWLESEKSNKVHVMNKKNKFDRSDDRCFHVVGEAFYTNQPPNIATMVVYDGMMGGLG